MDGPSTGTENPYQASRFAAPQLHQEATMTDTAAPPRTICEIASDIKRTWKNVHFGAAPYLLAMHSLDGPYSTYGTEDGRTIVMYFLANASTFRGDEARALKAELKSVCAIK